MVQWASLTSTSSAPPSKKPSTAAFTSEVNIDRHRSHWGVPGSTSAGFQGTFGMRTLSVVSGYDTFWRNLRCSAEDLQALMGYVLDKLDPADRAYLVKTLRNVAGNQRWGVWAAGSNLTPGNKDGWAQKPVGGRTVWEGGR